MNVELAPPILEPDDLLRIPDGDRYELIDGHLAVRARCELRIDFDCERGLNNLLVAVLPERQIHV